MVASTTNKARISFEEKLALEYEMYTRGFDNPHSYVYPAHTIQTDVQCPVCREPLPLYRADNSYRIKCNTEGCIDVGARGI